MDRIRWRGGMLLALAAGGHAQAATYIVGTGAGCTHATIPAALAAANASPGEDTVRITRSQAYTAQAISFSTTQTVELTGGYATCDQVASDGIRTVISGAGGSANTVLGVDLGTGAVARLRLLTLTGGDETATSFGGGLQFTGSGRLELSDMLINLNGAGYGGGIYAEGSGSDPARGLHIGANVTISSNAAAYDGGGVYADNIYVSMAGANSIIAFNEALGVGAEGGRGGGMYLRGSSGGFFNTSVLARISTGGSGNLGAIYSNTARRGGGVAVRGIDGSAELLLVSSAGAAGPAAIRGNFASDRGGGVHAQPDSFSVTDLDSAQARVRIVGGVIEDNAAPAGAAVYLDYDSELVGGTRGAELLVEPAAACPADPPCNRIRANDAVNANGDPTGGAIVYAGDDANLEIAGAYLQDNRYGPVLRGDSAGDGFRVRVADTLISGNQSPAALIQTTDDDSPLELARVTIAGNTIGGASTIAHSDGVALQQSIVYQPGTPVLGGSGTRTVNDVVANEVASLGAGLNLLAADPRLYDPDNGDYRPQAASPAVDYAIALPGSDLDGAPRNRDLALVPNRYGAADLGAYERQVVTPLVRNGEFNADLRLWNEVILGSVNWNSANGVGPAGSGSAFVQMNPAPSVTVTAATQCVFLPGPGSYRLTASGRSVGATVSTRDQLYLNWQLRRDGSEACNAGPPDSQGVMFVSASSGFVPSGAPATIEIPAGQWTRNSSLIVALTVTDVSNVSPPAVAGYFDGIALLPGGDLLLADSFE